MAFILEYRGLSRTLRSNKIIPPSKKRLSRGLLSICAALASGPTAATSDFLSDLVGKDSAGIGEALRVERSLYRGDGMRLDVLPIYLYEGEHFYLHSNRLGLKLNLDPRRRVDIFVSRRLESHPVEQAPDSLAGMAARPTESDAGFSFEQRFDWGNVFVEYLRDTSRTSGGSEVKLGYSTEASRGGLRLLPYVTLSARDSKLNDYYYGVLPSEATADRPAYSAGGGVNGAVGVNARYNLSPHWHLLAGLSATYWASTVRHSPIVSIPGVQLAGFLLKVGCPVINRLPHDRVVVFAMRDRLATGLEEDLIDAVLRPQKPESRFQALGQTVSLLMIQTLVINSLDSEYNANVTAFGQKDLTIQKAKDRHRLIESAGLLVVLDDLGKPKHGKSPAYWDRCTLPGHTRGETCRS